MATLPAAGALIAITPLIGPGCRQDRGQSGHRPRFCCRGRTLGLAVLSFLQASWTYAILVVPLVIAAAGLGLSNGPASAASTSVVPPDQVGQASGISNMARYVGGSLAVAAVGTVVVERDDTTRRRRGRRGGCAGVRHCSCVPADGDHGAWESHCAGRGRGAAPSPADAFGRPRCRGRRLDAHDPDSVIEFCAPHFLTVLTDLGAHRLAVSVLGGSLGSARTRAVPGDRSGKAQTNSG